MSDWLDERFELEPHARAVPCETCGAGFFESCRRVADYPGDVLAGELLRAAHEGRERDARELLGLPRNVTLPARTFRVKQWIEETAMERFMLSEPV